jgi:hypothetical protein
VRQKQSTAQQNENGKASTGVKRGKKGEKLLRSERLRQERQSIARLPRRRSPRSSSSSDRWNTACASCFGAGGRNDVGHREDFVASFSPPAVGEVEDFLVDDVPAPSTHRQLSLSRVEEGKTGKKGKNMRKGRGRAHHHFLRNVSPSSHASALMTSSSWMNNEEERSVARSCMLNWSWRRMRRSRREGKMML